MKDILEYPPMIGLDKNCSYYTYEDIEALENSMCDIDEEEIPC